MFYDTGKRMSDEQVRYARSLQWLFFNGNRKQREDAARRLPNHMMTVAQNCGVFVPQRNYCAVTDDGKIVCTTPYYFTSKEAV